MKKSSASLYVGQEICLATMHKKEGYLNPACEKILGASLSPLEGKINTDLLGTFSGEIERKGTQKETVLKKCRLGLEISGRSLGMASEGSFGPHPYIPFIPSAIETLVFVDTVRNFEIFQTMLFTKTNYRQMTCSSTEDLTEFLTYVGFPSHGVIVKPNISKDKKVVFKGIDNFTDLKKKLEICVENSFDKRAFIETDMRAHKNPTRGITLRKLGIRLFRRLTCLCPVCKAPGWGKTSTKKGRPCRLCECPSELPVSYIWSCNRCLHQEEEPFSSYVNYIDPRYCNICNP